MIFNGLVGLLSRFKSAGSDDRNAVIGDSGVSGKTKSSYQMLSLEGVDVSSCGLKKGDSDLDYAYLAESHYITINSLTNLVNSRLGVIKFVATGEKGDLTKQQIEELFDEIYNQCERLDDEINQHSKKSDRVHKKEQSKKTDFLLKKSVFDDYDDIT
tara:strand:+ start:205 stop:675 length:471 start_codon:yes stop_codon:yes gene_type:complete